MEAFSTFLMNANCYGYMLADHGSPMLGVQYVRLANGGPSPLLQLMDNRYRTVLMDYGILHSERNHFPLPLSFWIGRAG